MNKKITTITALAGLLLTSITLAHSGPDAHPDQTPSSEQSSTDRADKVVRESRGQGREPHAPVTAYRDDQVLGWSLHVHEDLIADAELWEEVKGELYHQLYRITRVLPEEQVEILKQVPIWVELRNPYTGTCQYHPSRDWLANNGYLPEKAKAIELSSARGFLRSSRSGQPYVMLHELAHAYHDRHLGFDHAGIIERFREAKAEGSYDQVLHISGRRLRAYAMTDHKEYFAEATEALFGTNDHYPFVRAELKEHDPAAYAVLREVWGLD
ncbi:MAG: metallopeptidase [Planctomycetota bacterium]